MRITTKMIPSTELVLKRQITKKWEEDLKRSLDRLNEASIDCLMLHRSAELRKKGAEYLYEWLDEIKTRKVVKRTGISALSRN